MTDLQNFDESTLEKETLAIFLVATHGEGEPTDNALLFFDWLEKIEEEFALKRWRYTCFGLGNKLYQYYNAAGKKLNKLLLKNGATLVYKYGEGDDSACLEDDFDSWKSGLWQQL